VVCPYCKGDIIANEASLSCQQCSATHHEECWTGYGKCASCKYRRTGIAKKLAGFQLKFARTWDKLVAAFVDVPITLLGLFPRILKDFSIEIFLVFITLFFITKEIYVVTRDLALISFQDVIGSLQLWGEN